MLSDTLSSRLSPANVHPSFCWTPSGFGQSLASRFPNAIPLAPKFDSAEFRDFLVVGGIAVGLRVTDASAAFSGDRLWWVRARLVGTGIADDFEEADRGELKNKFFVMEIKNTAGDALRQAFMSREDYEELREEEKVWRRLQKPLCMAGITVVWTVVVVAMMVMVDVVFAVSGGAYPFCQKRRLPSYDMAGSSDHRRGDLPSYVYTEEEAVDAFWLVAFLPSSFVFVFSTIYLFAGASSSTPSPIHLEVDFAFAVIPLSF